MQLGWRWTLPNTVSLSSNLGAIDRADVDVEVVAGRGDTDQTDHAAGCGTAQRVAHDDGCTGAFHQNIGLELVDIGEAAEMKCPADLAHDRFLFQTFVVIEHVDIEPALRCQIGRRQQTDWASAGDKKRLRIPRH